MAAQLGLGGIAGRTLTGYGALELLRSLTRGTGNAIQGLQNAQTQSLGRGGSRYTLPASEEVGIYNSVLLQNIIRQALGQDPLNAESLINNAVERNRGLLRETRAAEVAQGELAAMGLINSNVANASAKSTASANELLANTIQSIMNSNAQALTADSAIGNVI